MDTTKYKEAHRVSDADNAFLQYYDEAYCEGTTTAADERKHEAIDNKYSDDSDWYYQWNRDERHYYVVVD